LASCGGSATRQYGAISNRLQVSNLPHKPKLTHYLDDRFIDVFATISLKL
jgi:hypothetical protein